MNKLNNYKLLILNTCLFIIIISLICLNFYKLALTGFIYLVIRNNSLIGEKVEDYLVQKDRFDRYYKKRFPILFYVLPIIGILSGLGMFYTGYLLNHIFQEILFENVHLLSRKQEIQSLQFLFTVFSITFFAYIFIDLGIAIYVIQKANAPINPEWKYVLLAERFVKGIVVCGSAITTGVTVVAGAPEPSTGSNFIHTRTPFGRGWDSELGDMFTKTNLMKLQQYTGNKFLVDKLDELNSGTNSRLVSRDVYQRIIQDTEVRNKILNSPNVTDEELYLIGIKSLPEAINSTTRKSLESGLNSLNNKIKYSFDSLKNIFTQTPGESESLLNKSERDMDMSDKEFMDMSDKDMSDKEFVDMSDKEFEQKQTDVSENSVGKKAIKDQDLLDARRRGLGKGKKT